jgi:NTE family protein
VILASAAVPTLFRAVHLGEHVYWDGLFAPDRRIRRARSRSALIGAWSVITAKRMTSTNRRTQNHVGCERVRLAGARTLRDTGGGEPSTPTWPPSAGVSEASLVYGSGPIPSRAADDIRDRRNELAANISFQQEINFIGKINELAGRNLLADKAKKKYHPIKVRAITMSDEVAASLDYESKLSRDPSQRRSLAEHGKDRARRFLADLERPDADDRTALSSRDIWGRVKDRNWTPLYRSHTGV